MGSESTAWLPEGVSTLAPEVDAIFKFVNLVSVILFAGVVLAIIYFAYRYRRKHPNERPLPIKESKLLEAAWIVIPLILVLVTFTWGFRVYMRLNVAPPDSYVINVEGRQWSWLYKYPNGATSAELHVPADRPVRLRMISTDVIHSFFVPAFRIKQDVLPNRYSYVWFQATKPGTYDYFCTEYCGTQHSGMIGKITVHTPEDFQEWLQNAGIPADMPPAEAGKLIFQQQGCQACHAVEASGGPAIGPSLFGLFGKTEQLQDGSSVPVDENYLRESILEPQAKVVAGYPPIMPASYAALPEDQITALVEYIKTLQ